MKAGEILELILRFRGMPDEDGNAMTSQAAELLRSGWDAVGCLLIKESRKRGLGDVANPKPTGLVRRTGGEHECKTYDTEWSSGFFCFLTKQKGDERNGNG